MSNRNSVRKILGPDVPFELEPRRSFTTRCHKCADTRSKSHARSLSVYRDVDKMIRFQCHHPGCELNNWGQIPDPEPDSFERGEELDVQMPIPSHEVIPTEYMGDVLYWYKDINGSYLFANRRINFSSHKTYVPFVYTLQGFITGEGSNWPKNFRGLYGAETIPGKTKAVIVEGEKAAEGAKKIFPDYAVVSWLGGSNRGFKEADWGMLRNIDTVLVWPDNDEPGQKCMRHVIRALPCRRILVAKVDHLPHKADLGDNLTSEQVSIGIKGAVEVSTKIQGVWSLDEITKQLDESMPSRPTGFDVFDAHTKIPGSGLMIIEGRTKHGKSALAVALTSQMLRNGLENTVVYYSYEMTAAKVFLRYLKSINPTLTADNFRGTKEAEEIGELINSGRLQLIDQSAQLTVADIVVAVSKPQVRGGIIVIDYLQIVPMATRFGAANRQLMIKEMLDEIRVAAHKNNVLVIALSQLTPDYNNPRNDSPREAKDIHYSADLVLRVWNKAVGEEHPTYSNMPGNYIIRTFLNRDGECDVHFESVLEGGSKLTLKRRVKDR